MELYDTTEDYVAEIPHESRKESMIQKLLHDAVKVDDSTLINVVLNNCWNKERIFTACGQHDNERDFLIHLASKLNFYKTIDVFIKHGINLDIKDFHGNTSLHVAATHGNEAVVDSLFEGGCDPFIENGDGEQAIDVAVDETVREKIRLYSRQFSQVKLLKNLETWKSIVAVEEQRKEDEIRQATHQRQARRKTTSLQATNIVVQTPSIHLNRHDSGIISDVDSDKSSSNPGLMVTSVTSKTANIVSTNNSLIIPTLSQEKFTAKNKDGSKIQKSRSFSIKDITNQYNNVTSAIRKLSSSNRNGDKEQTTSNDTSPARKNSSSLKSSDIESRDSTTNTTDNNRATGGLKCNPSYGVPVKKTTRRRRKVDRTQRMSLPLMPFFSPTESYF